MTRDQWNARALLGTLALDNETRRIERRAARGWLREIASGERITVVPVPGLDKCAPGAHHAKTFTGE